MRSTSSATAAADGLAALVGRQVEGLVATDVHQALLGAVFGEANAADASSLLIEALASE